MEEKSMWLGADGYPTTIIADRYGGTYSGGEWLAFPLDPWEIPEEVDGEDVECMMFWEGFDGVVGRGVTPDAAFLDLVIQMKLKQH